MKTPSVVAATNFSVERLRASAECKVFILIYRIYIGP